MTLNEVTLLMEELNRHISDTTQVLFSTAVDAQLGEKISVSILGSFGAVEPAAAPAPRVAAVLPPPVIAPAPVVEREPAVAAVPPRVEEPAAPELVAAAAPVTATPETRPARAVRSAVKTKPVREEKQEQMTFEPVNRGRFEKSEPTIVDGQDLDVPAFMRMNVRVK